MGCVMATAPVANDRFRQGTKRVKLPMSPSDPEPSLAELGHASVSTSEGSIISSALADHFLFAAQTAAERETLATCFARREVRPGEAVFTQGQAGDGVYVLLKGSLAVYVDGAFKRELTAGDVFGELALLYAVARTATVKNVTDTSIATVSRLGADAFKRQLLLLNSRNQDRIMAFLSSDDRFSLMTITDRRLLASVAVLEDFAADVPLVLDGGHWLYVIVQGAVEDPADGLVFGKGDILGGNCVLSPDSSPVKESALLTKCPTTCLTLSRGALDTRVTAGILKAVRFGALRTALKRAMAPYKLRHDQVRTLAASLQETTIHHVSQLVYTNGQSATAAILAGNVLLFSPTVSLVVTYAAETEHVQPGRLVITNTGKRAIAQITAGSGLGVVFWKEMDAALKLLNCSSLEQVAQTNTLKQNLGRIFIFKQLNGYQQEQLVRGLKLRRFAPGEMIVTQGDTTDGQLYFILSGNVEVSAGSAVLRTLGVWDYFGERALLLKEPRTASCKAVGSVECMILDGATFRQIVGAFQKVLESRIKLQDDRIEMKDLEIVSIVGEGAFGRVSLVQKKGETSQQYALKQVTKAQAVKNKLTKMLITEREVLLQCNHPCIVQCIKTFKDKTNIYFLTEFLAGGDLFTAMRVIGVLTKNQVRFYVGSILLAIEYLHQLGFIYKDLKPEQVMMDEQGFVKLVDMGCAKKAERTYTTIGTPNYMAPDVIIGKGYGKEVDIWSLGIVMYELVCGPMPFDADDQLQLFKEILEAPLTFPPSIKDQHAIDLIGRMLERDPNLRIKDDEIKSHPYFEGYSFDGILCRTIDPPFKPDVKTLSRGWTKPGKGDALANAPYSSGPADWDKDF